MREEVSLVLKLVFWVLSSELLHTASSWASQEHRLGYNPILHVLLGSLLTPVHCLMGSTRPQSVLHRFW